jgi:N-acetylglucosamine malate deacetylase 1
MITFVQPGTRVLVLGAHPDDEAMCGGLLAKLADAGAALHHYWFSDCAISTRARGHDPAQLLAECERSRDILGIAADGRGGFDFPVREFPANRQRILDALIGLKRKIKPAIVLTAATADFHQDHSTLTVEAIRAFKESSILGYELPWNHLRSEQQLYVQLEQSHLDRKIAAIGAYQSQAGSNYTSAEFITSLARVRGVQAGCEYAESFEIIRMIL